jgi:hypothetical protein
MSSLRARNSSKEPRARTRTLKGGKRANGKRESESIKWLCHVGRDLDLSFHPRYWSYLGDLHDPAG